MKKIGLLIIMGLLFMQCQKELENDNSVSRGYISPQLITGNMVSNWLYQDDIAWGSRN